MKTTATLFLIACLWAPAIAQDLFLPLTTSSQNARFHYEQALMKAYNADFAGFDASMERALLADSALFMARYQQAIFALYFGNQEDFRAFGGKALAHTGEKNPAEQRLREILAKLSADPQSYVGDDFAEIAAMYSWVLEAQSAVSFYERRQKNHDKAIAAAKRSVALRPDFGPGYNTLAYAYLAAGKRDFARAAMEKYCDLQPEHPNPYDSLGDLWMEAGDYRKAARHYLTAYEKDPNWIAGKEKAAYALKKSFTFRTAPAPEWSALFRRSTGWFGGDGIFAIPLSGIDDPGAADEEAQIILFSDTMIGEIEDSVLQEGFPIVNKSVGIIRGKTPKEEQIDFFLAQDSSGKDKALFTPDLPGMEAGEYYWLGDGFRDPVNGTTYVFAYRVVDRPEYEFLKFEVVGGALIAIPPGSPFPYADQRQIALPFFFRGEGQQFGAFGAGILPNLESAGAPYPDGYIYVYGAGQAGRDRSAGPLALLGRSVVECRFHPNCGNHRLCVQRTERYADGGWPLPRCFSGEYDLTMGGRTHRRKPRRPLGTGNQRVGLHGGAGGAGIYGL